LNIISSLSNLIQHLDNSTQEQYAELGASVDIPLSEFLPFAHFSTDHYTRNCIKRTNHYELILLCWEENQETPVHCHGGEECWVYVVDGRMEESHFDYIQKLLIETETESLSKGSKSFMNDELGFHKLKNSATGRSMSLHLYMDPINHCTAYSDKQKDFVDVELSYHSYQGQLLKEIAV